MKIRSLKHRTIRRMIARIKAHQEWVKSERELFGMHGYIATSFTKKSAQQMLATVRESLQILRAERDARTEQERT